MKVSGVSLLLAANAVYGATLLPEKRQITGFLEALASGDKSILGALGSTSPLTGKAEISTDFNVL
jgi:hypothetical protein